MSSNGVDSSTPERRRMPFSRLGICLLIAFVLSVVIVLAFFSSVAVSR